MTFAAAALWTVTLVAIAIFTYRLQRLLRPSSSAPADGRLDHLSRRLEGVLRAVGLHDRMLQLRFSGAVHLLIFSGFIILFSAIVDSFGKTLFPGFSIASIGGDTWIALLQDVFATLLMVGIGLAAYQRLILKPARFAGSNSTDAIIIYGLVLAVIVSMQLEFAFSIAAGGNSSAPFRPLASGIAFLFSQLGIEGALAVQLSDTIYWIHIAAILGFLIYIPGSKHRHMFLAAPNIFMRNLRPKGQLPAASKETTRVDQFSLKLRLDLLSCTECGRCQAVCPAHAAGLPLSPKSLIMDMRDALPLHQGPLAGRVISAETLWACTTCRACMDACPVFIEHVPKIVDMRRDLVEQGAIEPMLQDALTSLAETGNSFGKPAKARARWTRSLPFKIKDARKEPVDVLWFVGDFASFDPRMERLTMRIAGLLNAAGVDFGILYDAEHNSGNDVRRTGEEGLFRILAQHNIDVLAGCSFQRIMTTDPHSLNALRQEYELFGVDYQVIHYTQLFAELIEKGALSLRAASERRVTYHDPCYLGRYNDVFDAPRDIIRKSGASLIEMGRCRENSFCCGAGGGRIWMDDSSSAERPSENRIKEAVALGGIDGFVVACPKDTVMYTAAVQNLGLESTIEVLDVADLVLAPEDRVLIPA